MSVILGSSNADYHANKSHLSSTQLKTLLKNPEQFYVEYILGQRENVEKDAFVEGTLVHALILEPHKIMEEYAIYPGLRKHGKAWEEFKETHKSKIVISAAQMLRAEKLAKAHRALPAALNLIEGTLPEHNMIAEILGVPVKARADAINIDKGYIVDVKTTSMPSDIEFFKNTVIDYGYQLSASLYIEIAKQTYKKPFDFYWVVLSKSDNECHVYKASQHKLSEGTALYTKALLLYKRCLETGVWAHEYKKDTIVSEEYEILEV